MVDPMRHTAWMKLSSYLLGQKVVLRSPLPSSSCTAKINAAIQNEPWALTTKIGGGISGTRLRLFYRTGPFARVGKPILMGRIEEAMGATMITGSYRAPLLAHAFLIFWYAMLGIMVANSAMSFPVFCLFAVVPFFRHFIFHRNADAELAEILAFLRERAGFSEASA